MTQLDTHDKIMILIVRNKMIPDPNIAIEEENDKSLHIFVHPPIGFDVNEHIPLWNITFKNALRMYIKNMGNPIIVWKNGITHTKKHLPKHENPNTSWKTETTSTKQLIHVNIGKIQHKRNKPPPFTQSKDAPIPVFRIDFSFPDPTHKRIEATIDNKQTKIDKNSSNLFPKLFWDSLL